MVDKQFAQAGVNWCIVPFLHWGVNVYPMGAQWQRHDDQVGSKDSLTWDPCKLLCLELWFTHPTVEKLRQSNLGKLHQLSADVHSSPRTAWGQASIQGGGNVMTWFARWAAVDFGLVIGPKLTDVQLYNWQVLE
jgi:hypothetical protein